MGASLNTMLATSPDAYTLTEDYNAFVESLRDYLRNDPSTRTIAIAPETGYLYRFDMTSFLLSQGVPLEDHRLILRINGLTSIHQIDEKLNVLQIPDQALISRLKQAYRTKLA